jgi:hypothetical protein
VIQLRAVPKHVAAETHRKRTPIPRAPSGGEACQDARGALRCIDRRKPRRTRHPSNDFCPCARDSREVYDAVLAQQIVSVLRRRSSGPMGGYGPARSNQVTKSNLATAPVPSWNSARRNFVSRNCRDASTSTGDLPKRSGSANGTPSALVRGGLGWRTRRFARMPKKSIAHKSDRAREPWGTRGVRVVRTCSCPRSTACLPSPTLPARGEGVLVGASRHPPTSPVALDACPSIPSILIWLRGAEMNVRPPPKIVRMS